MAEDPQRWVMVDAAKPIKHVQKRMQEIVLKRLPSVKAEN
jgi:thymidylate kinase